MKDISFVIDMEIAVLHAYQLTHNMITIQLYIETHKIIMTSHN